MTNDEKLAEAHMVSVDEATRAVMDATLAAGGGPSEILVALESTHSPRSRGSGVGGPKLYWRDALCGRLMDRVKRIDPLIWRAGLGISAMEMKGKRGGAQRASRVTGRNGAKPRQMAHAGLIQGYLGRIQRSSTSRSFSRRLCWR